MPIGSEEESERTVMRWSIGSVIRRCTALRACPAPRLGGDAAQPQASGCQNRGKGSGSDTLRHQLRGAWVRYAEGSSETTTTDHNAIQSDPE